jgi:hypothetical protein
MPSKSTTRKSWHEKLHNGQEPKIVAIPPEGWKRMGGATMLVSTPLDVDAAIRTVPKGKLVTSGQLRTKLAHDHGAECACPTSTGIFVRIAAEAAEEDLVQGKKKITPWWRVIKADGSLNDKLPGGAKEQAKRLQAEGHDIVAASAKRPPKVEEFEKRLVKW